LIFYTLVLTALLLPYSAIGGAAGDAAGNGIRRGAAGAGERTRWLRIGAGTAIIAGSTLIFGFLGPLIVVSPLVGGVIAGYAAGSRPEDGLEAGLVTALFGTGLFSIPLLWTASSGTGFVAGLAGMATVALGLLFPLFGAAGGAAGAVMRGNLRQD